MLTALAESMMWMNRAARMLCALGVLSASGVALAGVESAEQPAATPADPVAAAVERGVQFLKTTQSSSGGWTTDQSPGVTALAALGLLKAGVPASDPAVQKAMAYLQTYRQEDGGIYSKATHHGSYETAISLMVFEEAAKSAQGDDLKELRKGCEAYVRKLQWDESESIDSSDIRYGGAGYGRSGDRPDLSNTVFFLEALQATGATKDDPAVQRTIYFLSRCQNLESEHNTTEYAAKINDGGFYYTISGGGVSVAGKTPEGGLRSYGSMTYAGLKSMIYAGLTKDDPRVKAATDWIRKFYSVTENPGLGDMGLFYYYQMFAKSLKVLGEDQFVDAQGVAHDWRQELTDQLLQRQQENGSWVNSNARFMEGDPNLVTAYALMTLAELKAK